MSDEDLIDDLTTVSVRLDSMEAFLAFERIQARLSQAEAERDRLRQMLGEIAAQEGAWRKYIWDAGGIAPRTDKAPG